MTDILDRPFAELDATKFHDLLCLRIDVFVVEQECAYAELDGRDTEPATRHVWIEHDITRLPIAYLRLLDDRGTRRIGRVVTRTGHRGEGLAGLLVDHVIDHYPGDLVLDAQSYLVSWYTARGFDTTGPEFLDDGIPHVPMHRPASVDS